MRRPACDSGATRRPGVWANTTRWNAVHRHGRTRPTHRRPPPNGDGPPRLATRGHTGSMDLDEARDRLRKLRPRLDAIVEVRADLAELRADLEAVGRSARGGIAEVK